MYSDNGTNFVRAKLELEKVKDIFNWEQSRAQIVDHRAAEEIKWHFIPARFISMAYEKQR